MSDVSWSIWYSFEELKKLNFKPIPRSSGVYQIRCVINGKPIVIPRVGGEDVNGILYIGKTESKMGLRGRIGCSGEVFAQGVRRLRRSQLVIPPQSLT